MTSGGLSLKPFCWIDHKHWGVACSWQCVCRLQIGWQKRTSVVHMTECCRPGVTSDGDSARGRDTRDVHHREGTNVRQNFRNLKNNLCPIWPHHGPSGSMSFWRFSKPGGGGGGGGGGEWGFCNAADQNLAWVTGYVIFQTSRTR